MSYNDILTVKKNKFFKKTDLIIYAVIILIVVLLFVLMFALTSVSGSHTVHISSNGVVVFSYDFDTDEYTVTVNCEDIVSVDDTDGLVVMVYYKGDTTKYNEVVFDRESGGVEVHDANCSASHDCTYMAITNYTGTIICIPYNLIVYMDDGVIDSPVTG